jgi:hypothetical protein
MFLSAGVTGWACPIIDLVQYLFGFHVLPPGFSYRVAPQVTSMDDALL